MKTAIISLTQNGLNLSKKISDFLSENFEVTRYSFEKYKDENCISFIRLKNLVSEIFNKYDAVIFISACGIAVRMIAPLITSKVSDPAVIVIDESGEFVISLLSGHIGGANSLTKKIAQQINSVPVITTATDAGGKFSPDSFAQANNLYICEMNIAKEIASKIVNGQKIGFYSDYEYFNRPDKFFDDNYKNIGICISTDINKNPFEKTLHLIPKNIVVGVGCKKNTEFEIFEDFILRKLSENMIEILRVCEIHSIDLKKNEKALLKFSEKYKIPIKFYNAKELMKIEGNFTKSDFVMKTTGTDNVCERSALINADRIIVKKQRENGVTLAVAEKNILIDFERDIL